jgi:hypothetical protein
VTHAVDAYGYANKWISNEGLAQYGYIPADKTHTYVTKYAREWGVPGHENGRKWVVVVNLNQLANNAICCWSSTGS